MTDTASSEIHPLLQAFAQRMSQSGLKLATAESCTGGMLAKWLTTLPGSSVWFECGFVTYSNASKFRLLQVPPEILERHGAVSSQVAEQMAAGVLCHCAVDLAVSITGIAGPSGGSASKPVGTVYISIAERDQPICTVHQIFKGDRAEIRRQSAVLALALLMDRCAN